MTDPNAPLREVRRWMRVSTPVNKAASSGLRGRLPQIAGPPHDRRASAWAPWARASRGAPCPPRAAPGAPSASLDLATAAA